MTDNHNNPNEGIEQIINAAQYRGVPLVKAALTQKGYFAVAGNSITPPTTEVDLQATPQIKAIIDASIGNSAPTDPPAPIDPPPADVPTPDPLPPLPVHGDGTHAARASSVIDGVRWLAQATVGEDPQAEGQYVKLANDAGEPHPALRARFYADCVDVGAVNGGDGYDYHGSLLVEYDGEVVYNAHLVDFWRGTFNQTIRYGEHQPAWQPVDSSLFPHYATPDGPLPGFDLSKYDWSYNGLGAATYTGMAATGMRWEIAWVPGCDLPFVLQPSDESYAVTRKVADQSGVWPIYFLDDDTGNPFDITQYPNTSFLSYASARFKGNPIAQYGDTPSQKISGSPYKWDAAHATGYNIVAAAATMSARDRWHAGVWANAALTAVNPGVREQNGVWSGYQERATAWSLRSLFFAAYVSDRPDYYAARLGDQLAHGLRQITHPLGFQSTYINRTFPDGSKGTAPWEENYTRMVVGIIANKRPEWQPLADRLNKWFEILRTPFAPFATAYTMASHGADGQPYTTWQQVMRSTLKGSWTIDVGNVPWADEDIDALLQPGITAAQVSALIRKNALRWPGKDGDFADAYLTSCQGYSAILTAAVAVNCGDGPEWQACQTPTKPDWSKGWQWYIVPRAAA